MGPEFARPPRFNHIALSLPADLLDAEHRTLLCDFYGDVFGWQELETMTEDRRRLIFGCYRVEQFVFLVAEDEPMTAGRFDHFGFSVSTEAELDEILARAGARAAQDYRVEIVAKSVEDHGVLAITSIYLRYLLPMWVEIQWWDFAGSPAPG